MRLVDSRTAVLLSLTSTGVAGQVNDEQGHPVISAKVQVDSKVVKLGEQATFRKLLPTGSYTLQVRDMFLINFIICTHL